MTWNWLFLPGQPRVGTTFRSGSWVRRCLRCSWNRSVPSAKTTCSTLVRHSPQDRGRTLPVPKLTSRPCHSPTRFHRNTRSLLTQDQRWHLIFNFVHRSHPFCDWLVVFEPGYNLFQRNHAELSSITWISFALHTIQTTY